MHPVAASLDELLDGASSREPLDGGVGKSGARLERVIIDGAPYVLKHLDLADDWTARIAGDLRGAPLTLWERGILARLPDCLNQPIVAVAHAPAGPPGPRGGCALLMHDVSPWLVPSSDEPIPLHQHLRFMAHLAELHATFWDGGPELDVVAPMHRYLELSPCMAETEAALGSTEAVPSLVARGWPLLDDVAPAAAKVVRPLAADPSPLVEALDATPQTLVHSCWKFDNLGTDPEGRTIVLDWEQPGRGGALTDLAWYLAINCRRLPQGKQAAIDAYRDALEACGIDTGAWWERQLGLALLGALVQFGWEKALGGYDDELAWWEERAVAGARLLP